MTTLYKLVTQDYLTRKGAYNQTDWTRLQPPKEIVENPQMCGEDVYHAYVDFDLAFLLNPIHGNIENPRILLCEGDVVVSDFGKVGTFDLSVVSEIEKPEWVNSDYELDVRIWFAVLCAESVLPIWEKYSDKESPKEAILATKKYLKNKSKINSDATANAANAAYAAANAAANAAYSAAYSAANAANAAYSAARAAYAADAAYSAARAANAAANAAARADVNINLVFLAKNAVKIAKEMFFQ